MPRKLAALTILVGIVLGLAGCNTIEGIGQDVQAGGRAIEKAAKTK
jgi:predicted small secreted protein